MTDDEIMALIAHAQKTTMDAVLAKVQVPTLMPGTVATFVADPLGVGSGVGTVTLDGSPADPPVSCANLTGAALTVGARVMVLFQPPHGAFVTAQFATS